MKEIELLSPAGSFDALKAAVAFGADAVYMGGKRHNARIGADNFDEVALPRAIKYARLRGKRVYITLNTVFFESEFKGLIEYVNDLQDMGANAVILQDLGVAKVIGENCTIPMHASTQMGIHSTDGCSIAKRLGFERVILSREASLEQIRQIGKNSTVELEAFVHGALCSCFSGGCYYSYLKGGRSGNRGECAQPCRLYNRGFGYPLSTKDLMALELLPKMIDVGISSFKIEGRMKRPAYAGVVTDVYRRALDLVLENKDLPIDKYKEQLIKIYNRGGFTKGYFLDKADIYGAERPNHVGEKIGVVKSYKNNRLTVDVFKELHVFDGLSFEKEGMEISDLYKDGERVKKGIGVVSFSCILKDIKPGTPVFRTTDKEQIDAVYKRIENDTLKIPVDMDCSIKSGRIELVLKARGKKTEIICDGTEQAKTRGITKDDVLKSLSKLGGTDFVLSSANIFVESGIFVSVSELNALRRNAVTLLEKELIKGKTREKVHFQKTDIKPIDNTLKICIGVLEKNRPEECDLFFVYPKDIQDSINNADGIVLPSVSFDEDSYKIEQAVNADMIVVCNNLGQIERLRGKCRVWAGPGMNCTNSSTRDMLLSLGCEAVISSIEAKVENTYAISGGMIPAMTFVACPKKAAVGCESCEKENILGDKNTKFICVRLANTYSFLLKEYKANVGQIEYI